MNIGRPIISIADGVGPAVRIHTAKDASDIMPQILELVRIYGNIYIKIGAINESVKILQSRQDIAEIVTQEVDELRMQNSLAIANLQRAIGDWTLATNLNIDLLTELHKASWGYRLRMWWKHLTERIL